MVMPNYQGNPLGGIKLSGPEQQAAAGSFQILTGGMGLDALLSGGGGNVPLLSSASTDPVLSGLALAGSNSPLAVLMGGGSAGNDPAALLTSLVASGVGSDAGAPSTPTPQEKIEEAAVEALSNPEFALMLIRSEPAILQKIVKLLATTGAGGGGTVG
jgi:hypothetical protein